ncbi:MAG: chemotaxis protein CheB, partial [Luteimonas sp.]
MAARGHNRGLQVSWLSHVEMPSTPVSSSSGKGRRADAKAVSTVSTATARAGLPAAPMSQMIVGIGASAGGLEAFKGFLTPMPADSEFGFVLVQHLAPQHKSMLVELLGRHTTMPVLEAVDDMKVEARHVYVIPPNATLTIADGVLQLSKPAPPRQYRWPIDTFFTSLAEDQ